MSTSHCRVTLDKFLKTISFDANKTSYSQRVKFSYQKLSKSEVIEIVRLVDATAVLLAVPFESYTKRLPILSLHNNTNESIEYLKRVMTSNTWSDAHKMALLVSGALVIDSLGLDRTWELAQMKTDPGRDWIMACLDIQSRASLLKHYLIPGVISLDGKYEVAESSIFNDLSKLYDQKTVTVANFLSLNHPTRTLRDQYDDESLPDLKISNNLQNLDVLESIVNYLDSETMYSSLDFTASELQIFSVFSEGINLIAQNVIAKRVKLLDEASKANLHRLGLRNVKNIGSDSIDMVLRRQERDTIGLDVIYIIMAKIRKADWRLKQNSQMAIVLAQILVEQGVDRVLEIVEELRVMGVKIENNAFDTTSNEEVQCAFVNLAADVLNLEMFDYPFSWVLQVSVRFEELNKVIERCLDASEDRKFYYS